MSDLNTELAARMPWLYAPGDTYWIVSGTFTERHHFTDCLAYVVSEDVTGVPDGEGAALFRVSIGGPEQKYVGADRITRARQVLLVWADDPSTACDEYEQDALDRALRDR